PWLMSIITPLYKSAVSSNRIPVVANVVISNVPGPPVPLYMAGARMTAYYPVSIVTHGLALNITIHSYAGNLDYGLIAAKKEVPKLEQFGEHLLAAHAELLALAQQQTAATPRTPAAAKTVAKPKAGKTKTVARKSSAKPDAKPSTKKTTKRVKR
ncbi:MAG: WS/DGAT domain-containing protein, partial [Burkholderiales bacterium]